MLVLKKEIEILERCSWRVNFFLFSICAREICGWEFGGLTVSIQSSIVVVGVWTLRLVVLLVFCSSIEIPLTSYHRSQCSKSWWILAGLAVLGSVPIYPMNLLFILLKSDVVLWSFAMDLLSNYAITFDFSYSSTPRVSNYWRKIPTISHHLVQKLLKFPEKNCYNLDSKLVEKSNFLIT